MERTLLFFLSLWLLWSCNDNNTSPDTGTLIGKWKLIDSRVGTGTMAGEEWTPVDTEETYEFKDDGSFTSSMYPTCTGSYSNTSDRLNFMISCNGQVHEWSTAYTLDTFLIMGNPVTVCYEGCFYRYKKI